ncbi:MAG: hypothetical protein AVDCRST_MAG64-3904, partial [uncultured Phycisphaerae bacterium]
DHATRRFEREVGRGADGAPRGREGEYPPARRAGPAAARAAVGQGRPELRLRRDAGEGRAGRPVRRAQPTARLPLHVRPGLGRGVPELLVRVRPPRRRHGTPGGPGRVAGDGLPRAAAEDRGVQAADGLAVPVGLVARELVQPRLPRPLHARGAGHGRRVPQLHDGAVPQRGSAGGERLLQGPGDRRGLPHVLHFRPGAGRDARHVRAARPRAQGAGRGPVAVHDAVGAAPRPLRRRPRGRQ